MEEAKGMDLLQWHPAFFASIQIEFAEERDKLIFENEHQLGTKPKEIDVLITKKNQNAKIEKNIGRIFRKYNIIEYKSPEDYLSIDDYYKVYGYACFFKSETGRTNEIELEDITITFVFNHFPHKLMKHLKSKRHLQVINVEKGIYYIDGELFPIQLIHNNELSEESNIPENLVQLISSQKDPDVLSLWHKKAAKAESIEAFQKAISIQRH